MDQAQATELAREAIRLMLVVGAPLLLTALVVGLIVSLLQALTSVQDYTLSFVPKMAAVVVVLVAVGPWLMGRLVEFAQRMFSLP